MKRATKEALITFPLYAFGLALFLFIAWFLLLAGRIPPVPLTMSAMNDLQRRIEAYATKHHQLPASLANLPPPDPQYDSGMKDAWGDPIVYEPHADGTVVLKSQHKTESGPIIITFNVSLLYSSTEP